MSASRHNIRIVLLGDSTLDNDHWVNPEATVTEQLKAKLQPEDSVINLSMDGFTTRDVLQGANKGKAVSDSAHPNIQFYPLIELEKIARTSPPTHIILSVGGNDLRESLRELIFLDPEERTQQLDRLLIGIQNNYKKIIDKLKSTCPDSSIVMMLQYTPSVNPDIYLIYFLMQKIIDGAYISQNCATGLSVLRHKIFGESIKVTDAAVKELHHIMEKAYRPMIDYARLHQIPILDMSTSFDQTNPNLYVSQIEPGLLGANLIAEMAMHVIHEHDFNGPSQIYVKPGCMSGPILALEGDFNWRPHSIPKSHPEALRYFQEEYKRQLHKDQTGAYGTFFAKSHVVGAETLEELVEHAHHGGKRSLKVMQDLGWEIASADIATEVKSFKAPN